MTISRYLKKGIDTNIFESLENKNNTINKIQSNAKDNLKNEYSNNKNFEKRSQITKDANLLKANWAEGKKIIVKL